MKIYVGNFPLATTEKELQQTFESFGKVESTEIIREKAIQDTRQELPHSIYVDIADMEIKQTGDGPRSQKREQLWIRAFILVERESQKGMVVGHGGKKIKQIRTTAQKEIAGLFPYRIHLDLRVKVDPKWRRKESVLRRLVQ